MNYLFVEIRDLQNQGWPTSNIFLLFLIKCEILCVSRWRENHTRGPSAQSNWPSVGLHNTTMPIHALHQSQTFSHKHFGCTSTANCVHQSQYLSHVSLASKYLRSAIFVKIFPEKCPDDGYPNSDRSDTSQGGRHNNCLNFYRED
jgi:hypothetical protein